MKLPDWQQKTMKCAVKTIKGIPKGDRPEKIVMGVDNRPKKSEHRKKYNKLLKSGMDKILYNSEFFSNLQRYLLKYCS